MVVEVPHGIGLQDARAILVAWQSAGIDHLIPAYPGLPVRLCDVHLVKQKFSGTGAPSRPARGKHAVSSRRTRQVKGQTGARYMRKRRKEIEE